MFTLFPIVMAMSLIDVPYRWVERDDDPGRFYLYRGETQIGGYDMDRHVYRSLEGDEWSPPREPPIAAPCFGVAREKMKHTPRYAINGQSVSATEALEAVDKSFNDDRDKLRVTIVGPEAERRTARAAIEQHPDFSPLHERIAVRDYPPDHWALQVGFVTTGRPTIYCQAPSGKVLHRQDDFVGGAAAAVVALRRANEAYDPKRDPDLRPASFDFGALLKPATIVAALLLGFALRRWTASKFP